MATSSTIPAVRAALLDLARTALPAVNFVDGRPADAAVTRTMGLVGDVRGAKSVPVSKAGRKSRDERYDIDLVFLVARARGTNTDAHAAAVEILDAIDSAIADDVSLSDLDGIQHVTLADFTVEIGQAESGGPLCVITQTVRVVARLN